MKNKNNNNSCNKTRKLHNPQAYTPSIYFPNWLSQIPISKLSMNAKVVYGRLCQWANASGRADRSTNQLCNELGMSKSPMDRALKELREVGLIGTYQVEQGGVNHFEFYDHKWMNEQINENLIHHDPAPKQVLPHTYIGVTPTPKQVSLKYKSNIINNNINNIGAASTELPKSPKNKPISYGLDDLLKNNPHHIEIPLLEDWIKVRKTKRALITETAWVQLNKKLTIIENTKSISALDAFTRMVANGWQSLEIDWFDKKTFTPIHKPKPATDDTSWGKNFYINNQLGC